MSPDSAGPGWRLKDLSAGEYARLPELIDSCLALSPAARTDWLSRLESEDLRCAEILRRLYATSAAGRFDNLLETGELMASHVGPPVSEVANAPVDSSAGA